MRLPAKIGIFRPLSAALLRVPLNQYLRHQDQAQNLRPLRNNVADHLTPFAFRIERRIEECPAEPGEQEEDRE